MEEAVDDEAGASAMVYTYGRGAHGLVSRTGTVVHKDTVGDRQFGQFDFFAVQHRGVRMEDIVEIRREDTAAILILILALPAVINGSPAFHAHQTAQVRTLRIGIACGIGVDEGDTVEGDRNHHRIARGDLAHKVGMGPLTGHIFDDEKLVALRTVAHIGHLYDGRMRKGVTFLVFDIIVVSAEESQALDAIVIVRHGTVGQEWRERIGGDDKRTAVANHIGGREGGTFVVIIAEKTYIFVVVVMRGHEQVYRLLQVGGRCLEGEPIVTDRVFGLRGYPHRIHLVAFDVELHILVLVYTHVDIDILHFHPRAGGYTEHVANRRSIAYAAGICHVIVIAQRQRRVGLREERTIQFGEVVIHRGRIRLAIIKCCRRHALTREDILLCCIRILIFRSCQCLLRSSELCSPCIFGGKVVLSGDGLLEVSPALVGGEGDTRLQPVGILHIAVQTGYEGRLPEVRTIHRRVAPVDEHIIITMHVGEEQIIQLGRTNGRTTAVLVGVQLIPRHEIALRVRLHGRRSVGLAIGAEIESFYRVAQCTELGKFGRDFGIEGIAFSEIIVIETVILLEELLVSFPFQRIIVEDSGAGTFVFEFECVFRRVCRFLYMLQIRQFFHLEHFVAPEDGIESELHRVGGGIVVIGKHVIDRGVCHGFVPHKMAVDHAHLRLRSDREHPAKALTRIGIGDILFRRGSQGIESAFRLIIVKEGIGNVAGGIGGNTSAGRPDDILLVELGDRPLRIVLGEMAAVHIDTSVGEEGTSVRRHIVVKRAVLYDNRDVIFRRIGHIQRFGAYLIR